MHVLTLYRCVCIPYICKLLQQWKYNYTCKLKIYYIIATASCCTVHVEMFAVRRCYGFCSYFGYSENLICENLPVRKTRKVVYQNAIDKCNWIWEPLVHTSNFSTSVTYKNLSGMTDRC